MAGEDGDAAGAGAPAANTITAASLGEHASEESAWLAIHGKVYDVSKYLMEHPGGLDVMMEHAGKDATEDFEYYGHSDKAREQMAAFLVGDYEGGDPAPAADTAGASKSTPAAAQPLAIKIVQALLPLLLVVVALLIKLYADAPKTTADAPADAPVTANA